MSFISKTWKKITKPIRKAGRQIDDHVIQPVLKNKAAATILGGVIGYTAATIKEKKAANIFRSIAPQVQTIVKERLLAEVGKKAAVKAKEDFDEVDDVDKDGKNFKRKRLRAINLLSSGPQGDKDKRYLSTQSLLGR